MIHLVPATRGARWHIGSPEGDTQKRPILKRIGEWQISFLAAGKKAATVAGLENTNNAGQQVI